MNDSSPEKDKKPWLKSYRLGPYKLAQSLQPYPRRPLYTVLDDTAARYPNATAVEYCGSFLNYRELKEAADRLACALAAMGVRKGDRVASILPTCPQYIIANFAILKAGAVHLPCSILHKETDLVYEIGQSGAVVVICLEELLETVEAVKAQTGLRKIITTSLTDYTPAQGAPGGEREREGSYRLRFRELIAAYEPGLPQMEIDPLEDLACLAFTGGATGYPKGVMLTHYNRLASIQQGLPWALANLEGSIKGRASVLIGVPLFHAYGDLAALFAVYWGLRMLLVRDPRDTDYILELMIKYRPFLAGLVPTQLMKLAQKDLPRLPIQIMSGASHLPAEVREAVSRQIKMPISEGYGLTETSTIACLDLSGFSKITGFISRQKYSIGVPVPDTEVKLVNEETGLEASPGEPGHMYIRGPKVMKGYWPEPGSGLVDGWLPTGDIASMDEEGYFYIVDRVKDMANVSGYKVYTGAIDEILFKHPAVSMAAVIGVPDPGRPGSERIKAFVVLKEEQREKVTPEEIIEFCRERCAPYAVPRQVEFCDSLPLTATQKIFKRQLREEEIAKIKK